VDYIGVIIGEDLIARDGKIIADPYKRSKDDKSIFGFKKMIKDNPKRAKGLLDTIIKNTYRTLMTRGVKGCYVFCSDLELGEYLQNKSPL
jgi:DUF2075 family protein